MLIECLAYLLPSVLDNLRLR